MPHFLRRTVLLVLICAFVGCMKEEETIASADLNAIVDVKLHTSDGEFINNEQVSVDVRDDSVFISVPHGTDIRHLIPVFTITGVSIDPASGVEQDFSSPVNYTVIAENGLEKIYTVIITVRPLSIIYFGGIDDTFYALDPDVGTLIWKYSSPKSFGFTMPVIDGNTVYTGGGIDDGNMYAFDALTGELKWKFFTTAYGIESPPSVLNNTLYFGGIDYYFYALDKNTGELKWKFLAGHNVSTKAVFFEGKVIFGSSDGNMYALDAESGALKWKFEMEEMVNQSSPVIANGVVFIGNRDKHLYAVDAGTGLLKWKHVGITSFEHSSPLVADGLVYIGNGVGQMFAFNENTGDEVWTAEGVSPDAFFHPCIAGGKIFVTGGGYIYAFSATDGSELWKKELFPNSTSPIAYQQTVYVGGGGTGYFYALNTETGKVKWKYSVPNSTYYMYSFNWFFS